MTTEERLAAVEAAVKRQDNAIAELASITAAGIFGGARRRFPALSSFADEYRERERAQQAAAVERQRADRLAQHADRLARQGVA